MTLNEFQQRVHSLYQGDTSVPASTDSDWTTRLYILESAIRMWDSEQGMLWRELWALNDDEQDSSQTTDGSTTQFATTTNFRLPGGFVRLIDSNGNSTFYQVKSPEEIELYRNQSEKLCYFTGNRSAGHYLNFLSAPASGYTINYPFYKEPTIPSDAADIIEMSRPMFAVEYTLSKLHELDGEGDRASLALAKAQAIMNSMRTENAMAAWHQDNSPKDRLFDIRSGGFGK